MIHSLAKLTLSLLIVPALALCQAKIVTPTDIADIANVSDPQISPDGTLIAYVVDMPVPSGAPGNSHIWLVSTDKKSPARVITLSAHADLSPRWSPDGKRLAFLSDRGNPLAQPPGHSFEFKLLDADDRADTRRDAASEDGNKPEQQIWEMPLDGGEALPLTAIPGGVKSFKWSKDGRFIGFLRTDGESKDARDRKKRKDDAIFVDHDYHFGRLWLYDRAGKTARLITKQAMNIDDFDFSPDGSQVVARTSPTPRLNDYWYVSKVVLIDLGSGEISRTLCEKGSWEPVYWSPDGKSVLYGETTERKIAGTPVVEFLASGKKVRFGADLKATLRSMRWNADSTSLTAEGVEGTKPFFAELTVSSGEIHKLTDVVADGYDFTLSADSKVAAYLGQTPTSPNDVWTYARGAGTTGLTSHNPQTAKWSLGTVREISWSSSKDGRKIYGVLVLPPNYVPGQPQKTLVHAHGGPFEAWQSGWMGTWYEWAQLLASHGYVVLAPNPRGSQGQGVEFQEANYQDWGGGDFNDVMDGVDYLVKEKIADPGRLGIAGWSYGGFMTSWAITHTNRFKAAMAGAAVTDLYGMSTTTDISPNFLNEFFGDFIANRTLYDAHSPMRFIENCHTPTLVLHGDADERVPPFQGEELYQALQLMGRESQLVRYPREPHIFHEREHVIDSLQRIIDWFDAHIR